MQRINETEINKTMVDADIQSVSIASGNSKENIVTTPFGDYQDRFGAASLSKPVFTYLVLKLISAGILDLDTNLNGAVTHDEATNKAKNVLSFAEFCKNNKINWVDPDSKENRDRANQFTPASILSHQTGLPIGYNDTPYPKYGGKAAPLKFDFEPGKGYGYSGLHLMYLQQWIEEKTGRKLEDLAKEFVFKPAGMINSSFDTPKGNAANSLHTTTTDYARFCIHWMNDTDPLAQDAFKSKVPLSNDPWAVREKVSPNTLSHLSWGYGWGLEKDDDGKLSAFHTGDMSEWRSGVKLDLETKSVTVFFSKSNSQNGHVLQDQIFGKSHALDYFFDKYKFARDTEELRNDWKLRPSYGIRKEPAKPSQVNEGPNTNTKHDTSREELRSKYMKFAEKTAPPKPTSTTSSAPTAGAAKPEEPRKRPGMTPLSTQFKPPGSTK